MSNDTINIKVKTAYLEEHSEPNKLRFVFSYTIRIENHTSEPAKLLNRHWIITDTNNNVQEVKGDGVVGEQPHILPGANYVYSSSAILKTSAGTMEGSYTMLSDSGETFQVPIPAFALTGPHSLH